MRHTSKERKKSKSQRASVSFILFRFQTGREKIDWRDFHSHSRDTRFVKGDDRRQRRRQRRTMNEDKNRIGYVSISYSFFARSPSVSAFHSLQEAVAPVRFFLSIFILLHFFLCSRSLASVVFLRWTFRVCRKLFKHKRMMIGMVGTQWPGRWKIGCWCLHWTNFTVIFHSLIFACFFHLIWLYTAAASCLALHISR